MDVLEIFSHFFHEKKIPCETKESRETFNSNTCSIGGSIEIKKYCGGVLLDNCNKKEMAMKIVMVFDGLSNMVVDIIKENQKPFFYSIDYKPKEHREPIFGGYVDRYTIYIWMEHSQVHVITMKITNIVNE